MKNGILIIAGTWALLNFLFYLAFGLTGAVISTYCCMAVVWFGRKKLSKLLKI
jgi:hypothetical protein